MAEQVVTNNGYQYTAFVYEGEPLALEYPDGTIIPIPPDKVHMFLISGFLLSGEPCKILLEKSPISRLDIVVD
jgi:hypothetical protein